jgi:hypothetical protein
MVNMGDTAAPPRRIRQFQRSTSLSQQVRQCGSTNILISIVAGYANYVLHKRKLYNIQSTVPKAQLCVLWAKAQIEMAAGLLQDIFQIATCHDPSEGVSQKQIPVDFKLSNFVVLIFVIGIIMQGVLSKKTCCK